MDGRLKDAYEHCMGVAQSHYENFPVASWLIPKDLRIHVATIYTFARQADDIADEGDDPPEVKKKALQQMGQDLDDALNYKVMTEPLYCALRHTIHYYTLDPQLFHDLLDAFTQDVDKTRYQDFNEVMDYCRRSANPVGRLMLQLFREASEENLQDSDKICSALQLINFMQDIQQDLIENDRVYFPLDEMKQAGVSIDDLKSKSTDSHVVEFVRQQTQRAQQMMLDGSGLGHRLSGRFGMEIRAITNGGLAICDALLAQGNDIYSRPRLSRKDKVKIFTSAIF